jgi:hypothetical protein
MALSVRKTWVASDGAEFSDEQVARKHEDRIAAQEWYRTHPLEDAIGTEVPAKLVIQWLARNRLAVFDILRALP